MNAPWVVCKICNASVRYWHLDGHMHFFHDGPPPRIIPRAKEQTDD